MVTPGPQTPGGTDRPSSPAKAKPRPLATVLWLLALAAAVFAAWQVRQYLDNRPPAGPESGVELSPFRGDGEAWSSDGPLPPDAAGLAGLSPLAGDPGELPPPSGAVMTGGWARIDGGVHWQQGRYRLPADAGDVAAHYRSLLESRGLRFIHQRHDGGGWRMLFAGEALTVNVALRRPGENDKIQEIVVVVMRRQAQ